MTNRIPRHTLDGVTDADVSVHPFASDDGLGLALTRFRRAECDDVILLVHGLTSSSDLFIMPEHRNAVSYLLDAGFTDVWAADFRMSNRFPYNTEAHQYTLDDIADYDHPAALRELRRHIGDRRVHVISHCLGSLSFMMSLFAGRVTGLASVTCNSVALTPRVPAWSGLKLSYGPAVLEYLAGISSLDPGFARRPRLTREWVLARLVARGHEDCGVSACHMLSFMWGSGHPAMYEHANLLPETHERMGDLCGAGGTYYYRHVSKMVQAGHAVKCDPADPRHRDLPEGDPPVIGRQPRGDEHPEARRTGGAGHQLEQQWAAIGRRAHHRVETRAPGQREASARQRGAAGGHCLEGDHGSPGGGAWRARTPTTASDSAPENALMTTPSFHRRSFMRRLCLTMPKPAKVNPVNTPTAYNPTSALSCALNAMMSRIATTA